MAETFTSKTFKFELVSPERLFASEEAAMVVLPGRAGDFGVLAEHAPFVSSIRPGVISIHTPAGEVKKIFVSGGFADVEPKLCSVLAEEAVNVNDLDRAGIEKALQSLNEALAGAGDDMVRKASLARDIKIAEAKLAVAVS